MSDDGLMTEADVVDLLRNECAAAGGQANWARAKKLSQSYVSDVLLGRRRPATACLNALGLYQCVGYRRHK